LIAWVIWRWRGSWKLKVTGDTFYNIFDLFLTKNHMAEILCVNFISPRNLCSFPLSPAKKFPT
jgi:hypothetical protein